jgi:hypothetical protein
MTLGSDDQKELDHRTFRIQARPDFQEGVRTLEAILRADPMASQPAVTRRSRHLLLGPSVGHQQ